MIAVFITEMVVLFKHVIITIIICFVIFSRQKTLKTLMFFQRQVSLCNIYVSFPLKKVSVTK